MISLNKKTGEFVINDITITPNTIIKDLEQYNDIVNVLRRGENRAIITIKQPVHSNGIDAKVKITIDEEERTIDIEIWPITDSTVEDLQGLRLKADRQWLLGFLKEDEFDNFTDEMLNIDFSWGYLVAMYYGPNRDYSRYGGAINICYNPL